MQLYLTENTVLKMWSGIKQRSVMIRDEDAKTEAGDFSIRIDSYHFG